MGTICGILGKRDPEVVKVMARALSHRGDAVHVEEGKSYAVASSAPIGSPIVAVDGSPQGAEGDALSPNEFAQFVGKIRSKGNEALRGAFAAVCHEGGQRWVLLRDRLGRRPLYYYCGPDFLMFASELKALLSTGRIERVLNLSSVDRYLTLRCVPGSESILQDVYRVQPGHVVEYDGQRTKESRFAGFEDTTQRMSREGAAKHVRGLLEKSLARADANGLLWSAGIDCAALGALGKGASPLFVQLERAWQDEGRLAKESARRLGLALEVDTARRMNEETFSEVVRCLDEPIADASVLPLWLVLESAGNHEKKLLSGHGADEMLGGYSRYHFLQKTQGARNLVPVALLSGIQPSLPPNAFVRRWSRYLASIRDNFERYLSLLSVFDHEERDALYTDAMKASLHEHGESIGMLRAHFGGSDLTHNLMALDLNVGLPDFLLTKCDRIAAAHGVSLEFPYLDDAMVDFAIRLSPAVKFGVRSKPVLRLALKDVVPGRIRLRRRRGFRIPQHGRLVRVLENVTRQVITQERVEATGLFKWQHVEQVLHSATHNVYRRRQYWALLMFFAWYREFMEA